MEAPANKPQTSKKVFLKYLGSVYILRESGISIDYDYAGGKDPEYMISRVIRKKKAGDYSKIFICPIPGQNHGH